MASEIRVPALGESVVEATVAEWLKNEGDPVKTGDVVVRLETDKVDVEVSAEQDGALAQILRQKGEDVRVGDALGMIAAAGETVATAGPKQAALPAEGARGDGEGERVAAGKATAQAGEQAAPARGPEPVIATSGEGDEGRISPLARRVAEELGVDARQVPTGPGGRVTREDVEAFASRRLEPAQAEARATLAAPQAEARATPAAPQAEARATPAAPQAEARATSAAPQAEARATPAVPQAEARATPAVPQAEARATLAAPQAEARATLAAPQAEARATPAAPQAEARATTARPEERVRFSRRRQTIARRLVEAQQTAAMLTTFNEIDMSAVMALRGRRKEAFKERHGVGLGFMSFFVKASIGALKAFPQVNAELQGDELVLKKYYDIGIAIGAEEGLVVPVLRDADRMSFAEIERGIEALAQKSRAGTLSLDDLRGGTFTITNGGVFGSLLSTPILNPPQVGILGMHKIEPRPIALNDEVVIRPMMYVALSYDHRVIDGREAVQFLVALKRLIEDPEALLLEG